MKPVRVQLSRRKGATLPPNTVSVARTRGAGWGNPFIVGSPGIPTAAVAVAKHREYMLACIAPDNPGARWTLLALEEIRGKNLACWCELDEPCHADTLLELANR